MSSGRVTRAATRNLDSKPPSLRSSSSRRRRMTAPVFAHASDGGGSLRVDPSFGGRDSGKKESGGDLRQEVVRDGGGAEHVDVVATRGVLLLSNC
jgi:hypothetical protein